jgi:hypothetical protein
MQRSDSSDELRQTIERARQALDEGRLAEARDGFRRAIESGARDSLTFFNLGLVEKLDRRWEASMHLNRLAAELDPRNVEAHWNLGVAASALRDWETARWAWQRLGFEVGTSGPPAADYGLTPIRLNATPDGEGEVVWARRIDPCRARIESVPLPESGHRFGDVVLHDVVPRGSRRRGDRSVSVFDELIRMDPSDLPTHEVEVAAPTGADLAALLDVAIERGSGVEDWSSISFICAECSLADAHRHEGNGAEPTWAPTRRVGLAGPRHPLDQLLRTWAGSAPGRGAGALRQLA